MAAGKTIAVSWKTFQEERWKTDEAAIKAVVEAAGDTYVSTDAQGSAQKQAADIESLISQGVDVILVVAYDSDAILPSFRRHRDAGIKMIAYDVLVEDPNALYITFDNVGVGRLMAQEMLEKGKPEGNFAFIKGDKGDPNATFLFQGMHGSPQARTSTRGKITNVCETFTDGWKPDNAQKNMEQCLTSTNNGVDAVLSENDGMASGVVAALDAQGLAGTVPVTGQDGDMAALNRVALGTQLVSVWKNSRAPRQDRGRSRRRHRRRRRSGHDRRRRQVLRRRQGRRGELDPARRRTPITKDNLNEVDRRRLDHQGRGLRWRRRRCGPRLRLICLSG